MTPQRYRRIRQVLDCRQPDLTMVLDQVNKPHNLAAILRTCDAAGVLEAHAVAPDEGVPVFKASSAGSGKWVGLHTHSSVGDALGLVRRQGMQVLMAHDGPGAMDFREPDYTGPTAVVLGAERFGPSAPALEASDRFITIPMLGMAESLNVSVAAALILYEAQRQRQAAGMFQRAQLDAQTYWRQLFRWGYPRLARRCDAEGRPYPALQDADGSLVDWAAEDGE